MGTLGTMAQPCLEKGWRLDDFRERHMAINTHVVTPVNCEQFYAGKFAGEIRYVKIMLIAYFIIKWHSAIDLTLKC